MLIYSDILAAILFNTLRTLYTSRSVGVVRTFTAMPSDQDVRQFTNVVYLDKSSNELFNWSNHTRMIRRYHITVTGRARWLGGRALDLRSNGR